MHAYDLGVWAESTSQIAFGGSTRIEMLVESDDADRTMNTVKAIVDAGVLHRL